MPYFIGGEIQDRAKLSVQTPKSLNEMLNLEVRVRSEVLSINAEKKSVLVKELTTGREYEESYDELILSLGAKPFLPPIPGIDRPGNMSLRNLEDMDNIVKWITSGATDMSSQSAVVAGGGFIGIEMAEYAPASFNASLPYRLWTSLLEYARHH